MTRVLVEVVARGHTPGTSDMDGSSNAKRS
jgi:hypothetical protein